MEENISEIRLGVGHSLVLGHLPTGIIKTPTLSNILGEASTARVESFGFWEASTPNYNTYYPNATKEDLDPKEEEFITPVFRLLSEVIVNKGIPIDFSKPGVLKASMSKLVGQTVNIDHETMVGNAIGAVAEVYWQNSYKTADGKVIPAGINGVLKIDGKSNPRIARGIMMKPPSIHSNSVTIRYKWEPSHNFEDMREFYEKVGTYDKEGKLIRCVVTEVLGYTETSLVSHGADPYAQKIENGKIINPEYAAGVARFSEDKGELVGSIYYDTKEYEGEYKLDSTIPKGKNNIGNNKTNQNMDKEILKSFQEKLGLEEGELTTENFVDTVVGYLTQLEDEKTQLEDEKTQLESEKTQLESEKTQLESEKEELEVDKEEFETLLRGTKQEALRLYKLNKGDKADETIIDLITNSNLKTAAAFVKQFRNEAEDNFKATCQDCGSTKVKRATAKTSKEGLIHDDEEEFETETEKSPTEVISKLRDQRKKKSIIFKNNNK